MNSTLSKHPDFLREGQVFSKYLVDDWFDLATHELYRQFYVETLEAASNLGKALNEYCGSDLPTTDSREFRGCLLTWRDHVDFDDLILAGGPTEVTRIVTLALDLHQAVSALARRILPPRN